jgi:hypothetical protein
MVLWQGVASKQGVSTALSLSPENADIAILFGGVISAGIIMVFLAGNLLLTLKGGVDRTRYWLLSTAALLAPAGLLTVWPQLWVGAIF